MTLTVKHIFINGNYFNMYMHTHSSSFLPLPSGTVL